MSHEAHSRVLFINYHSYAFTRATNALKQDETVQRRNCASLNADKDVLDKAN